MRLKQLEPIAATCLSCHTELPLETHLTLGTNDTAGALRPVSPGLLFKFCCHIYFYFGINILQKLPGIACCADLPVGSGSCRWICWAPPSKHQLTRAGGWTPEGCSPLPPSARGHFAVPEPGGDSNPRAAASQSVTQAECACSPRLPPEPSEPLGIKAVPTYSSAG